MNMKHTSIFTFLMIATINFSTIAYGATRFYGTGDLSGNIFRSEAIGVSPDGSVVVGASHTNVGGTNVTGGFVWTTQTGIQPLTYPQGFGPGSYARGVAITPTGIVVTGIVPHPPNSPQAYRWSPQEGMVALGANCNNNLGPSDAYAISGDGSTVVGIGCPIYAFRWTQRYGMESLGALQNQNYNWAFDVSGDGGVIVGRSWGIGIAEAFMWTEENGMVGLGDLDGGEFKSSAQGVSYDGTLVVGYGTPKSNFPNVTEAFLWVEGKGMTGLGAIGPFPVPISVANAVANTPNGAVVVGESGSIFPETDAFIWDEKNGMQNLRKVLMSEHGLQQLNQWKLMSARDISADGKTIVGIGINPQGQQEGWVVTF